VTVPLSEAINSGAWFKCNDSHRDREYKLKIIKFSKVDINKIDSPEQIDRDYDLSQGNIWLMRIEIINLCKEQWGSYIPRFTDGILISDQDGYLYEEITDSHICNYSKFAKSSGLSDSTSTSFMPKIKYTRTLCYYLPKEDEVQYFIAIKHGEIIEI